MGYKRALIIRFGGLGDILLATPTIRALAAAYPGIQMDMVVGGGMNEAIAGHPQIRNVLLFDKRGADARLDHFLAFLGRLWRARYDLVVNLHPSAKSLLMAAACRARTVLTFQKRMEVQPETGRARHAVDDFVKTLEPLGIGPVREKGLDFIVPPEAQRRIARVLEESDVTAATRLLVINPIASRPINRWPLERFAEVAAHFARLPGMIVAVTGAPPEFWTPMDALDEGDAAQNVASAHPRIVNLAGQLSVKELGALLTRADAFLTCDTGPMHIGAAVQAPLVVLSGAADPDRTGPLTDNSTVLMDRTLTCAPCRDRLCARGDVRCMQNISVENVIAAIEGQIVRHRRSAHGIALPVCG